MFGLYHLSKFSDLISPLFLVLWLVIVISYYAVVTISDYYYNKVRVNPLTLGNNDKKCGVEAIEDDDFHCCLQSTDNEQMETWSKKLAINDAVVHELINVRDQIVSEEANNTVDRLIHLGMESAMDRILYPRYDRLGNVANPDHFHRYSDTAIFVRHFLYEAADNAVSICEHPLRKQMQELERIQREAVVADGDSSDSSSSSSEVEVASESTPSSRRKGKNESSDDGDDIVEDDDEDEDDYHDMYSDSMNEDDLSESRSEGMSESDFYSDSMDGSHSSGSSSEYESYGSSREANDDGVGDLYEIEEEEEEEGDRG